MIEGYWYPVARAQTVRAQPVGVSRLGTRLALWRRADGTVACVKDRCPHRGARLSLGKVVDGELRCAFHGFRFDCTGACTRVPANGKDAPRPKGLQLTTLATREAHGLVWAWWGEAAQAKGEPELFDEVDPAAPGATAELVVPIPFVRWMESMLDDQHFPYVHPQLMPRGAGPLADPYHCEVTGGLIRTWGRFRPDDGRPREQAPGTGFRNHLRFPNLMYTAIDGFPVAGVFFSCPVDAERTWVAYRYYAGNSRVPGYGRLMARVSTWLVKHVVIKQDYRVQLSQEPFHSGVGTDRLVARADAGIAAFHRLWREAAAPKRAGATAVPEGLLTGARIDSGVCEPEPAAPEAFDWRRIPALKPPAP